MKDEKALRIIDANLNRLREGLRILEDYARFSLERRDFFLKLKELRHQLSRIEIKYFSAEELLAARQAGRDSGGRISTSSEKSRLNLAAVIIAEFKRTQQAARVLEELSKISTPAASLSFKKIRFAVYQLEKDWRLSVLKKEKLDFRLYLVLDATVSSAAEIIKLARLAAQSGVKIIQLRAKNLATRNFLKLAYKIKKIIGGRSIFIINDRLDIAAASGADGVHLGTSDLPVKTARKLLGEGKIIGFSADSVFSARRAEKTGADYLGCGALFATPVKTDIRVMPLKKFLSIQKLVKIPVVAIGGINPENFRKLIKVGVKRVAVVRALSDPKHFKKNLGGWGQTL